MWIILVYGTKFIRNLKKEVNNHKIWILQGVTRFPLQFSLSGWEGPEVRRNGYNLSRCYQCPVDAFFLWKTWMVHWIRVSGFRRTLQSQAATQQFCLSPKGGNSGCLFDALWGLKTYFLTVTFSSSKASIKGLGYKKTIARSWSHPVVISFKMIDSPLCNS